MDPLLPLAVVGAVALAYGLAVLLHTALHYLFYSYSYASYKGKWAVVTGASAGIGAGFARRLASRGVNVVLLARSKDKLDALSAELAAAYSVSTLVIPFDFGAAGLDEYAALAEKLAPLAPSILINNVGVNVDFPTEFTDMNHEDVHRIVRINVGATNAMTAMLLPAMVSASNGLVICLSSGGGVVSPAPLLAPYAGTKAYNDSFALALAGEVGQNGVLVHSLTPFFVQSAMAKMRKSFTVPDPDTFAECALRQVGSSPRLQPYWVHHVMASALRILPLGAQVKYVARLHRSIRTRALRKQEKLAKQN